MWRMFGETWFVTLHPNLCVSSKMTLLSHSKTSKARKCLWSFFFFGNPKAILETRHFFVHQPIFLSFFGHSFSQALFWLCNLSPWAYTRSIPRDVPLLVPLSWPSETNTTGTYRIFYDTFFSDPLLSAHYLIIIFRHCSYFIPRYFFWAFCSPLCLSTRRELMFCGWIAGQWDRVKMLRAWDGHQNDHKRAPWCGGNILFIPNRERNKGDLAGNQLNHQQNIPFFHNIPCAILIPPTEWTKTELIKVM